MNSRARWGAGAGSRGLNWMLLSRGSPGTMAQWSNTDRPNLREIKVEKGICLKKREERKAIRLTLSVRAQICFKTEWINDRDKCLHSVEWWAWFWSILRDMTPTSWQHVIYLLHTISSGLDLHIVNGLHKPGCGHQKGGVCYTARCWNNFYFCQSVS